jgi:hypothetical protein
VGGALVIVGHGMRERQQRGPLDVGAPATVVVVRVRRYLCHGCEQTLTVVPSEVTARRHYSAAAIALAIALYGAAGLTPSAVRYQVSPWRVIGATAATGWVTLRRWLRAVRRGELFGGVRASPAGFTLRRVAERAAMTLAACAPPSAAAWPIERQAFAGAMVMA